MMMSPKGGAIAPGSTKQKLNTRSSTKSEMVASDDFLSKMIWSKNFLHAQGLRLNQNILLQDNLSTKLLMEKGRSSCGKRSRTINIRYFAIKDFCERGELKIQYCNTEDMVGDYMTKPLQGSRFRKLRTIILGLRK